MPKAPSREAIESCRDGSRWAVWVKAPVYGTMSDSGGTVLVTVHAQIYGEILEAAARRDKGYSSLI